MVSITKKFEFEAAHFLPDHPGLCKNLHGHSYKLEIEVEGQINKETGMVIDFGDLKKIVNDKIINSLDHVTLNNVLPFPTTAENMVKWIWNELPMDLNVVRVRLYETSNSYAEYK